MVKSGTSFLTLASSTNVSSLFFMIAFLPGVKSLRGRGLAARLGLFSPPAGDGLMVAAEQHLRHLHPAKHAWPGVLRILQPAGGAVRLLGHTRFIAQHAGH